MYHKSAIKKLALAIIMQAGEDLHLDDRKKANYILRETARYFFEKSKLCEICVGILEINTINKIHADYKNNNIKVQKLYKHKRKYRRRKVII